MSYAVASSDPVRSADAYWLQRDRETSRFDSAVDAALAEMLADGGSVEEAIGNQSDVIHAALQSGLEAAEVVDLINTSIRSYLRAQAEAYVERNPSKWRD